MKPFRILRHACTMVGRTLRSYALLSVTVVLSFSLLLGYLLYTDASLYNRYKTLFAEDPHVLSVPVNWQEDAAKLPLAQERLAALGGAYAYVASFGQGSISDSRYTLPDGREVQIPDSIRIYGIPRHIWALYFGSDVRPVPIQWLDGREARDVSLGSGEMLMSQSLFHALGLEGQEAPVFSLSLRSPWRTQGGQSYQAEMRVVGVYEEERDSGYSDALTESVLRGTELSRFTPPSIVIPLEDFDPALLDPDSALGSALHVYAAAPELAVQAVRQLNFKGGFHAAYEEQQAARERMRVEGRTKAVIAAALLLLLGLNLYSSFSNALNDRKFEIGVKRAIGASGGAIVRQFLYESLLVMGVNILLSIALVTDLGILYKLLYEATPDEWGNYRQFVLYLSPHSAAMFALCALSLAVVFSLIFAWKSTQVEVVDYLKAE